MNPLTEYMLDRLPAELSYDDLAQLCISLHVSADGIPAELQPLLQKEAQAQAFADFVTARYDESCGKGLAARYGANHHDARDKGHWIEVIASLYKIGNTLDHGRAQEIRSKLTANTDCSLRSDPSERGPLCG